MSARPTGAVVLLSGGLDSTTVLALAAAAGRDTYALSFRYGQRHEVELECARRQARRFGARAHEVVDLGHVAPLVATATSLVRGSPLTVPRDAVPGAGEIPSTYVPARNTLFLAYALAWAEALGAREIWLGVNALDYSGYPDCRPEFIDAFQHLADLATRAGVEGRSITLQTPLLQWTKAQIVEAGRKLDVDYADTISCYDPSVQGDVALACGHCDSCQLRRQGFAQAGVPDPTRYLTAP
jgi:7-cyano-7-deazaguanine synthase